MNQEKKSLKDYSAGPEGLFFWRTAFLIALPCVGYPVAAYLHIQGLLPDWATLLIGCLLMNLSFTTWHDPSHENFSRSRLVNDIGGFIACISSVYPGYFARRREHLVHHRWEGEDGKDPVYPRIQNVNFFTFPFKMVTMFFVNTMRDVPPEFQPITGKQKIADSFSNLFAVAVIAASFYFGYGLTVMLVWVLPRLVILLAHAYYICYYPHYQAEGGYRLYRVRKGNPLIRFLTVDQNFHGLHHKWQKVPWFHYADAFYNCQDEVAKSGVELEVL